MAAIRFLKVRLIWGFGAFSTITNGSTVGSLMLATHDVLELVLNEKGHDFSNLKGKWTVLEIVHVFFLASRFHLYRKSIQMAMKTRTNADAHDRPRTRGGVFGGVCEIWLWNEATELRETRRKSTINGVVDKSKCFNDGTNEMDLTLPKLLQLEMLMCCSLVRLVNLESRVPRLFVDKLGI
ncbi:hypothetical protein FH972_012679 [Carpinus fangiana]|uniref:Uncharacterized protein n=1 Tax=Carpinus fangiana TaxID=176857 RepID=A0A5N6R6W2_9ROSI|nr:hypothetical protein FH972_012679 [Carpinus fangiana]